MPPKSRPSPTKDMTTKKGIPKDEGEKSPDPQKRPRRSPKERKSKSNTKRLRLAIYSNSENNFSEQDEDTGNTKNNETQIQLGQLTSLVNSLANSQQELM